MDGILMKGIGEVVDEVLIEAELQKRLAEEKTKRVQECGNELVELLKKYNCSLITSINIAGSKIKSEIILTSN